MTDPNMGLGNEIPWYKRTYTCEGLTYNWPKLLGAMGLILLGFFTYTLCLAFVPSIMPLKLGRELGADNKTIAFIMSTIGQVFNITICPMVSFQSDRFRSKRWGRRIPFILFTMPMMCAAWLLFAFVDSEADFLSAALEPWCSIAPTTMAIVLIGIIMAFYQFFLMYVGSVIYYIYNDTIPAQFLARFVGLIHVVCGLANVLFSFFVFQYGLTHFRILLLGTIVVYTLGVGAMCLFLREPRFPAPETLNKKGGASSKIAGLSAFFRESFSHKFYWLSFFGVGAFAVGGTTAVFQNFFYLNMGLTMEDIGQLGGTMGLAGMVLSFTIAMFGAILIDRWHPARVYSIGVLFMLMTPLEQCKWLFFTPERRVFWIIFLLSSVVCLAKTQFTTIASMPMLMRLYPKSRFGQFCSAQSMLRSGMVLVAGLIYGGVVDLLKYNLNLGDFAYRFGYVWQLLWYGASGIMFALMYREFLKLGGFKDYHAPAPWAASGLEAMPVTTVYGPNRRLLVLALRLLDGAMLLPALGAGVLTYLALRWGFTSEATGFLHYSLPAACLMLVVYWSVRGGIALDIRRALRGEKTRNGLPHHGLVMIYGAVQTGLFLVGIYQAGIVMSPESGTTGARMLLFECVVGAVFAGLIWIYTRVERGSTEKLS